MPTLPHCRGPRSAITLMLLVMAFCFATPALRAELITVGPLNTGCAFDDLIDAGVRAALTPEADTIVIAQDLIYDSGVPLFLTNEANLTLRGVVSCSNFADQRRTITATRGDLLSFTNTDLTIRSLNLVSDTMGGRLLKASGSMLLTIEDARVASGKADDGANVHLSDGASLLALAGAEIVDGQADTHGGGVYCIGTGTVALVQGSRVAHNTAGGAGGGIHADVCFVNVLSGGPVPGGMGEFYGVFSNSAFAGGGIYISNEGDLIVAGTSTTEATVRGNQATFGGGIFASSDNTQVTIENSTIAFNEVSQRGGGLYVTAGATLTMDRTAENCSRGQECSFLWGNNSVSFGNGNHGGAIGVTAGGRAEIRQTYFLGNRARHEGRAAYVEGAGSFLLLEGVTMYKNDPRSVQILTRDGGHARLAFLSVWGGTQPGFPAYFLAGESNSTIELYSSIIIEGNGDPPAGGPADQIFAPAGNGVTYLTDCLMVHEVNSVPNPNGSNLLFPLPDLVWADPSSGSPRLAPNSPAIDYCDSSFYEPVDRDVDNEVRGNDLPEANNLGPFDLGSDEHYVASNLPFMDGFESGDTSAWDITVP